MRKGNILVMLLAMVAVGALVAIGAYTLGKNQSKEESSVTTNEKMIVTPTEEVHPTVIIETAIPNQDAVKTGVVVLEPLGAIPEKDQQDLMDRVANPLVDYYKEQDLGTLLTLTISKNTQANANTYPYLGKAILDNGGSLGFVIERVNGEMKWWKPECMGECPFSLGYKTKYPEVVK